MAKVLTEAAVLKAMREIKRGGKTAITLADAAPRGAGRLVIIVKPESATWYAQQWANGKRTLQKLGVFPFLAVADARAKFREHKPTANPMRATVGELFDGYLATLAGRPSHTAAKQAIGEARKKWGDKRLARSITPLDVVEVIKPIYQRGARAQADKVRMYIGAAYAWAMEPEYDYRDTVVRQWGITTNPVRAVKTDDAPTKPRTRALSEQEFVAFYRYLAPRPHRRNKALLLMLLTGQRTNEILRLRPEYWNSKERIITWPATKSRNAETIIKPHSIPVCTRAAAILDSMRPRHGWYFPNQRRPTEAHMIADNTLFAIAYYCENHGVPIFTNRDIRRTWKTLTGAAGITKEERDRLQNHNVKDVSNVHYDMWHYMPEKRAAMARWEAFLSKLLT